MKYDIDRETDTHVYFWNTVYSQWFGLGGCYLFTEDGKEFWTAEHYMMYKKAELFGDEDVMAKALTPISPRHIKALGREIKKFNDELWNKHKLDIVIRGTYLKFIQNKDLKEILEFHKDKVLVEASPEDKIWGIGLHFDDDRVLDESQWQGENLLGIAIMKARDLIFA